MKNKYYLEFLENYPEDNPYWFEGLKYMIKREDFNNYYIDKKFISKLLEDTIYKKHCVKTLHNLPNTYERG